MSSFLKMVIEEFGTDESFRDEDFCQAVCLAFDSVYISVARCRGKGEGGRRTH